MFTLRRRARATATSVGAEFCESCAQVCTPACRSEAQRERVQVQAAQWHLNIR
ncbi:hypothetical protein HDA40_001778 [Hamadaea flava]|uniref:Uncharacterized protein n=1 Tax=Hamadaea flava TaxID=1742688 RepID=A0ABV8LN02_9ACTN|nr:hypothetical protein [Hamadaea flava]MCP2323271.1 hypothetical protein [Hamadaea flava]